MNCVDCIDPMLGLIVGGILWAVLAVVMLRGMGGRR